MKSKTQDTLADIALMREMLKWCETQARRLEPNIALVLLGKQKSLITLRVLPDSKFVITADGFAKPTSFTRNQVIAVAYARYEGRTLEEKFRIWSATFTNLYTNTKPTWSEVEGNAHEQ